MAFQTIWYFSGLPKSIIDVLEQDIKKFDENKYQSKLYGDSLDLQKRNSKNSWVPTEHWSGGFLWHYVNKANNENFMYDIDAIDNNSLQYTFYEPGQFYDWHVDDGISTLYKPESFANRSPEVQLHNFLNTSTERVRKLSVILQLSDPDDYEGGNVEIMDDSNDPYILPRIRGTVCVFDSRAKHRVTPVTKGLRKSLVGWVIGPRWK